MSLNPTVNAIMTRINFDLIEAVEAEAKAEAAAAYARRRKEDALLQIQKMIEAAIGVQEGK